MLHVSFVYLHGRGGSITCLSSATAFNVYLISNGGWLTKYETSHAMEIQMVTLGFKWGYSFKTGAHLVPTGL